MDNLSSNLNFKNLYNKTYNLNNTYDLTVENSLTLSNKKRKVLLTDENGIVDGEDYNNQTGFLYVDNNAFSFTSEVGNLWEYVTGMTDRITPKNDYDVSIHGNLFLYDNTYGTKFYCDMLIGNSSVSNNIVLGNATTNINGSLYLPNNIYSNLSNINFFLPDLNSSFNINVESATNNNLVVKKNIVQVGSGSELQLPGVSVVSTTGTIFPIALLGGSNFLKKTTSGTGFKVDDSSLYCGAINSMATNFMFNNTLSGGTIQNVVSSTTGYYSVNVGTSATELKVEQNKITLTCTNGLYFSSGIYYSSYGNIGGLTTNIIPFLVMYLNDGSVRCSVDVPNLNGIRYSDNSIIIDGLTHHSNVSTKNITFDSSGGSTMNNIYSNSFGGDSKALISNTSKQIIESSVTATELGYLSGTTSNIQTQLNSINSQTKKYVICSNSLSSTSSRYAQSTWLDLLFGNTGTANIFSTVYAYNQLSSLITLSSIFDTTNTSNYSNIIASYTNKIKYEVSFMIGSDSATGTTPQTTIIGYKVLTSANNGSTFVEVPGLYGSIYNSLEYINTATGKYFFNINFNFNLLGDIASNNYNCFKIQLYITATNNIGNWRIYNLNLESTLIS